MKQVMLLGLVGMLLCGCPKDPTQVKLPPIPGIPPVPTSGPSPTGCEGRTNKDSLVDERFWIRTSLAVASTVDGSWATDAESALAFVAADETTGPSAGEEGVYTASLAGLLRVKYLADAADSSGTGFRVFPDESSARKGCGIRSSAPGSFPQRMHYDISGCTGGGGNVKTQLQTLAGKERDWCKPNPNEGLEWVKGQLSALAHPNGTTTLTLAEPSIDSGDQKNLVAKWPGADGSKPVVIVGAHLDDFNRNPKGDSPGVDDNATGVVVLLEAVRRLFEGGYVPVAPVEVHFYGGEEYGLRGSGKLASIAQTGKRSIAAVLNVDMAGDKDGAVKSLAFLRTQADPRLGRFIRRVARGHAGANVEFGQCVWNCSDHASWSCNGFSAGTITAAADAEDRNPDIHTERDTVENIDLDRLETFIQVVQGYIVEMAGQRAATANSCVTVIRSTPTPPSTPTPTATR